MTRDDHRIEAEQAMAASVEHRIRWGHLATGTEEADAAIDAAFWELGRAKVHALLSLGGAPC